MSVFISYNHNDKEFADRLAKDLVIRDIKVWKDSWRIGVGDSLIQKIQEGLEGVSFLCVVFSKNSIKSEWVKREITAGLLREIEERKVVILPLIIDECKIPLLLRDKVYADFRSDYESGLNKLLAVLIPYYSVQSGGAISKDDKYFIHFSGSTKIFKGKIICEIDIISFDLEETYSILTQFLFKGTQSATITYSNVDEMRDVTNSIIMASKKEFELRPAHISLSPGKDSKTRFSLHDTQGTTLFNATSSVKILGDFHRSAVRFNIGSLFSQISNTLR